MKNHPRQFPQGINKRKRTYGSATRPNAELWTSEPMLAPLTRGLKGKKWFSLIDKVSKERTLQVAWEKVCGNAVAFGVDGITIGSFEQNPPESPRDVPMTDWSETLQPRRRSHSVILPGFKHCAGPAWRA